MTAPPKPAREKTPSFVAPTYAAFLRGIKARIQSARTEAALAVNRELIALYWEIGRQIVAAQAHKGYGDRVVERLAVDLARAFPDLRGFTVSNLWRMRAVHLAYTEEVRKLAQPVRESRKRLPGVQATVARRGRKAPPAILAQAVREFPPGATALLAALDGREPPPAILQIPWGHNVVLIQKLPHPALRLWYAEQSRRNGWSRAALELQIANGLHLRQGQAPNNFAATLPATAADQAAQVLKDPYTFDFLSLGPRARERDFESALLDNLTNFLLELGAGFAFVGRQFRLAVDGEEFFLDLLFYHTRLHCYIVIDLKTGDFQPEFAGKMSFYQTAVDNLVKTEQDAATIGLILCKGKSKTVVEYTLRDMKGPMGVAEYRLLPPNLKRVLPTTGAIEKAIKKMEPH